MRINPNGMVLTPLGEDDEVDDNGELYDDDEVGGVHMGLDRMGVNNDLEDGGDFLAFSGEETALSAHRAAPSLGSAIDYDSGEDGDGKKGHHLDLRNPQRTSSRGNTGSR